MFFSYVPNLRFENDNSEWKLIKIKTLLKFQNGLNESQEKYGKGTKYISVSDILNNDYIMYDCIKGFVDINIDTFNNFIVEYGDILFQRSSETIEDIGRSNVYLDKVNKSVFGGFIIRGKKIGEYDPIFFKHLLDTPTARKIIIKMGAGAQHYNISQDGLEKISLYFPTLEIQNKIGIVLSKMDLLISTQNKIIEEYKSLKNSIINQLIFNNIKLNQYVKLSDFAVLKNGYAFKNKSYTDDGKFNIITIANVQGDRYINISSCNKIHQIPKDIQPHQILDIGDILISLTGNVGRVSLINISNCLLNQRVGVLKFKNNDLKKYIFQVISNKIFENKMILKGQGAAQKNIGNEDIESFLIPFSQDISYINEIVKLLECFDEKIAIEKQIINDYLYQKKYLLANMFI